MWLHNESILHSFAILISHILTLSTALHYTHEYHDDQIDRQYVRTRFAYTNNGGAALYTLSSDHCTALLHEYSFVFVTALWR